MNKKILCICAAGINRSKYLAKYLKQKGYKTRFGGVETEKGIRPNLATQKDIDWADVIIIVRKRIVPIFNKKFKTKGKKIIKFDVSDSRRLAPKEYQNLGYEEFQEQWTRPKLRKAIEKYLPL